MGGSERSDLSDLNLIQNMGNAVTNEKIKEIQKRFAQEDEKQAAGGRAKIHGAQLPHMISANRDISELMSRASAFNPGGIEEGD